MNVQEQNVVVSITNYTFSVTEQLRVWVLSVSRQRWKSILHNVSTNAQEDMVLAPCSHDNTTLHDWLYIRVRQWFPDFFGLWPHFDVTNFWWPQRVFFFFPRISFRSCVLYCVWKYTVVRLVLTWTLASLSLQYILLVILKTQSLNISVDPNRIPGDHTWGCVPYVEKHCNM